MKKVRRLLKKRDGTTLVETIVTMLLISIMFAMAATALSSAAKVFVREQRLQYAQSILDTTMTELRGIVENADGYIKIYDVERKKNQKITDKTGNNSGNILEFINGDGYAVLISADGCEKTQLFIGRQESGEADAVDEGQLLIRYYFYNNGTYQYIWNDELAARAVATVFGKGFYMGNYLEVQWAFPDSVNAGDMTDQITVTASLYRDRDRTDLIATDSEVIQLRHSLMRKDTVTATVGTDTGE